MSRGPEEVHRLIAQLQVVRDRAVQDKAAIVSLYPFVDPEHDARITAFSKLINVLNSLQLSFTFISMHLLDKEWWMLSRKLQFPIATNSYMQTNSRILSRSVLSTPCFHQLRAPSDYSFVRLIQLRATEAWKNLSQYTNACSGLSSRKSQRTVSSFSTFFALFETPFIIMACTLTRVGATSS
jgi:hypothetical protein